MLKNKTTVQIITSNFILAKSVWRKALGLMFHKKANLIMYFKESTSISLHNFFVFYPLEVIILDAQKKVVEIKKTFHPFTLYTAKEKGIYCVELGKGASKNKCSVGDILEF